MFLTYDSYIIVILDYWFIRFELRDVKIINVQVVVNRYIFECNLDALISYSSYALIKVSVTIMTNFIWAFQRRYNRFIQMYIHLPPVENALVRSSTRKQNGFQEIIPDTIGAHYYRKVMGDSWKGKIDCDWNHRRSHHANYDIERHSTFLVRIVRLEQRQRRIYFIVETI